MSGSSQSTTRRCLVCEGVGDWHELVTLPLGTVSACSICGVHSILPQPNAQELAAAYQNFNAGEIARQDFAAYVTSAKGILRDDLATAGLDVRNRPRFLDYGCGGCHFVKAAFELGLDAQGIDVDAVSANFGESLGLRIAVGDYRDVAEKLGKQPFSAILLMHVLEHVPHPADVLRALLLRLESNGILIIRVPDQSSLPSRIKQAIRSFGIKKGEWGFVQPPIHLHGFTLATFATIARLHNLEIVRLAKISPLDQRQFPSTDRYWRGLAIQKQIYRLGNVFGSGGHIVAILRHKNLPGRMRVRPEMAGCPERKGP